MTASCVAGGVGLALRYMDLASRGSFLEVYFRLNLNEIYGEELDECGSSCVKFKSVPFLHYSWLTTFCFHLVPKMLCTSIGEVFVSKQQQNFYTAVLYVLSSGLKTLSFFTVIKIFL